MKQILITLAVLIVTGCTSLDLPSPGQAVGSESDVTNTADIDCNRFIGRWAGEKIWSPERTSYWVATHRANGTMRIDFTTVNQGEERKETYVGNWRCSDGIVQTTTLDPHNEKRSYTYRILELSERFMHYQVVTDNGLGPKFVAERVR